jgi:hypothetical protein
MIQGKEKMNLLKIKHLEKYQNLSEKQELNKKRSSFAIKSMYFGLFALIGFVVIVYSIFVELVEEALASIADTVFVAAIIGSLTLVGIIISQFFLKN